MFIQVAIGFENKIQLYVDRVYAFQDDSFLANAPPLKSSYNVVKMTVYFDIINSMENCMVINELKNPHE